jgi:hypothetical protein
MGNELERKRLRPNFKHYTEICLAGLTKARKIFSQSSRRPGNTGCGISQLTENSLQCIL